MTSPLSPVWDYSEVKAEVEDASQAAEATLRSHHRRAAEASDTDRMTAIAISMLQPVIQIGAVRIEPVSQRLLRVLAGSDQPAVLDAIRRAGGRLDGTRRCYWVPAAKLRKLETELRANADLFRLP